MKLIRKIRSVFRQEPAGHGETPAALALEGVPEPPVTAEPDEAELAVQALLELLSGGAAGEAAGAAGGGEHREGTLEYYNDVARKIRQARETATQRTTRFVAWCEEELAKEDIPREGRGSLRQIEVELYKRLDTVEREGGALKRRWQHCLAEVTVRLMQGGTAGEGTE